MSITIEDNLSLPAARQSGVVPLGATVVLPTHGRRTSLLRVLRALGRQDVPAGTFEVVVVCDGDVDGSAGACRALAPELPYTLRVIEQANAGPAAARNRGVADARTPLIIFIDDDVVPNERFIATHLAAQEGQEQRVAIGPLLPPTDDRLNIWGAWEERTLCRQYDDMVAGRWDATYRQFYTGNASVPKRQILAAGGFDPSFRRAEDVELALRLHEQGLHFVFLPAARGWHYIRRGFAAWQRTPAAYGAADVAMARVGRPWILTLIAREYRQRTRPLQMLTKLCVGRPGFVRAVTLAFGVFIRAADALRAERFGQIACSFLFGVLYYHGLSGALGGRAAFMDLLDGRDPDLSASAPPLCASTRRGDVADGI
jgi:GT2 family glycosyltransferase